MGVEHKASSDHEIRITRIALDLEERSLTVENQDRVLARVTLAREGLVFQGLSADADAAIEAVELPDTEELPASNPVQTVAPTRQEAEKRPATTFQGKLKTKPTPGRVDRRGNPTACARFAAHVEDEEQAHMYFATFHRHTAALALDLDPNIPITVEGYPHASDSPGDRLDTLSVIHLLDYPGKPQK